MTFYLTGSSTPAVTYADAGLTTPNPNPVTAASNGRFGNIFLDPSVTYKVVLQDGNGVQQWTADPVQAPGANVSGYATYATIAALRASTVGQPTPLIYVESYAGKIPVGGGWFQYVASDKTSADNGGTIIVDTSGNRYYRLFYGACSIDNFGAVQDSGLTDNSSAINAALSVCQDVLVPGSNWGGWYGFGEPLTLRTGGRLTGEGKTSRLTANASFGLSAPLLQNASTAPANTASRDDGIVIENLIIDANSQGTAAISLVATQNFRIRGVRLLNGTTGLNVAAKTSDPTIFPENGWIEDLNIFNFQADGIIINSGAEIIISSPIIDTCAFVGGEAGIRVQAAVTTSVGRNIKLLEPIVRNCGSAGFGILFDGAGSASWTEMSVTGGSIDAQNGTGLSYRDVSDLQVEGLNINAPTGAGVARLTGGSIGAPGLMLEGVKVKGAGSDGFYLSDAFVALTGCVARNCGRDGVRLDGASNHVSIIGGIFTGNTGYGVNEISGGGADFNKVWGSHRSGNTAGKQILTGANSICDDVFVSGDIAITINTGANVAHGLGMKPKATTIYLRCVGAELGHSVGDVVEARADAGYGGGNAQFYGASAWAIDSNNCGYAFARDGVDVMSAGSAPFTVASITPANWRAFVVAKGYY